MGKLDAVGIYNKSHILAEPNSADWAFKNERPRGEAFKNVRVSGQNK